MTNFACRALLAAAFAALCLSAPASAADAVKPVPCQGLLLEDAVGDQVVDPSGGFGVQDREGEPNLDIENVFMTSRNGKLSANIQISKLDKTVPDESPGGVYYYVSYTYGGVNQFVKAFHTGGEVSYAHGVYDSSSQVFTVYNTDEDTTGAFFEGDHGVVQIDIPAAFGGKPGETLSGVYADVDIIQGADDFFGSNVHSDSAPDGRDEGAAEYTAADCPAAAPVAATPKVPDTSKTPAPAGSSSGSGSSGSSGSGSQSTSSSGAPSGSPPRLPFGAPKLLGKAGKKGRKLTFKVRATDSISGLVVQLKTLSGSVVASGKLAKLTGTKKLSLKLSKTLKKGRYTLVATGTVDGRRLTSTQAVGLR